MLEVDGLQLIELVDVERLERPLILGTSVGYILKLLTELVAVLLQLDHGLLVLGLEPLDLKLAVFLGLVDGCLLVGQLLSPLVSKRLLLLVLGLLSLLEVICSLLVRVLCRLSSSFESIHIHGQLLL